MERWEFDRSEDPPGWRWLRIDTETEYVRRCCDRYFETLRECVEDAVRHGYEVPLKRSEAVLNRGQTPNLKSRA